MKDIPRDANGKFYFNANIFPKKFNSTYSKSLIYYLNCLDPLFEKAQAKCEFQFILTLLRNRGVQDAGWDAYENSVNTLDEIMRLENKVSGSFKGNLFLWVYAHIVEASEPYETIANLLNILNGDSYRTFNFPKRKTGWGYRNQYPIEKIVYLEQLAKKVKMPDVVIPIKNIFDKDLRNAIFHSDYSFYEGEVRLNDPSRIYSRQETLSITNKALAYHEVMKNMIEGYQRSYKESKFIDVSHGFSNDPNEKAVLIIRKNHGVTGMRDNWNPEELKSGRISWFIGKYLGYEQKYLDRREVLLPPNKIERLNRFLRLLPNSISKRVSKIVEKHFL